jgi:uncharacterized protein (DUF2147 family)
MPRVLTAAFALSLTLILPAKAAAPVSGLWLTTEKDSVVEIAPCGEALCGRITRILSPTPKGPPKDTNNPDPALRSRPIQGLAILTGFKDTGKVWQGTIYDPRAGKTYKSYLTLLANGTLQVKGCIGPFCRAMPWTRAR